MEQASDKDTPIVKLNKPTIRVEGNEQEGFIFLLGGATVRMKNHKAHDDIRLIGPYRDLKF